MMTADAKAENLFTPATAARGAKVFLIAEIGVNHDGRAARAIELVRAAAEVGADAVKFQYFNPRRLLSRQAILAEYQKANAEDVFAMLESLMLGQDEMMRVRAEAERAGLGFIATLFSMEDAGELARLRPMAVKIASPDAVNRPLLETAAGLGRPMVVSTGTAEMGELEFAADLIRKHAAGGCLLQCVSSYPTPDDSAALGGIAALAERFAVAAGYSDHTTNEMTGALAVAAGACVIEKHLTYDRKAKGPDHAASFAPAEFARYAAHVRAAAKMVGARAKLVQSVEADVRLVARQSVCVARDLAKGHLLTREDLTVKRPGTGIAAARLNEMIGKRLACDVRENDLLRQEDLE